MELFTYLMAKNDHNTSVKKDLFSYLLGKNQSGTYTDYSGTSLSINNTKKGKMKLSLYGNTSQTGTPTPSSPIPVNVVSGDNEVVVCGKNLIPFTNQDFTLNGLRYYVDNGNLYVNGTSSGETYSTNASFKNNFNFTLPAGTYTLQRDNNVATYIDNRATGTHLVTNSGSFTLNETTEVNLGFYIYRLSFTNQQFKIQLEKSNTATTYEPYQSQTYPINLPDGMFLGEIGTYKDKFIRNSGKNLFDVFSNVFLGSPSAKTPTISSDGKITSEANYALARGKGMFVELESNTTYTLSFNIDSIYASTGTARVFIEGKIYNRTSPTTDLFTGTSYDTTGTKSITFTTPTIEEGKQCGIIFNGGWNSGADVSSTFSNAMIEKGSQATPYEPYGNGEWYLEKKIGKIESYNGETITTDFISTTGQKTTGATIYYGLSSPTYTPITGTLKDELEAVWRANSYKGQTNISQVNDDLPFNMNVSIKVGN